MRFLAFDESNSFSLHGSELFLLNMRKFFKRFLQIEIRLRSGKISPTQNVNYPSKSVRGFFVEFQIIERGKSMLEA